MKRLRYVGAVLLAVLMAASVHAGGGGPPESLVEVALVKELELTPNIRIPATVLSIEDAYISADMKGRVVHIREVGERVETGNLLIEIDSEPYRLALQEIEAAISPLEIRMQFEERESQRLDILATENYAARNRLDEMESNYNSTKAEISQTRARIDVARENLKRTKVYAPFAGVISERYHAMGEYAEPGAHSLRLVGTDNLEVQARIPAYAVSSLAGKKTLRVIDGQRFVELPVRALVPVGDKQSRLYELRLNSKGQNWMSGYALRVEMPVGASRRSLAVPNDALVIRRGSVIVYRVDAEGKAQAVEVRTGLENDRYIAVDGALREGDRVIIRGNERLRPGASVRIVGGVAGD
ncbi:MAG: efflux RND transporter periplasmic adaptor subunit [Candidatus Eutrophobiaceae bacterium]